MFNQQLLLVILTFCQIVQSTTSFIGNMGA